jgi:hypothetical protein
MTIAPNLVRFENLLATINLLPIGRTIDLNNGPRTTRAKSDDQDGRREKDFGLAFDPDHLRDHSKLRAERQVSWWHTADLSDGSHQMLSGLLQLP